MSIHAEDDCTANLWKTFGEDGYIAPVRLFSPDQCRLLMAYYRSGEMAEPLEWEKGLAAADRLIFDAATTSGIARHVHRLLGDDVILWGAMFVGRRPGTRHAWHCDIESTAGEGSFISVWIGLENTTRASSLKFVRGSHNCGRSVQRVQFEEGFRRGEADDEQILAWARRLNQTVGFVRPKVGDGEAVIFDGRIWHGSTNGSGDRTRTALLLQFATAGSVVRIPDPTQLEWPHRFETDRRPPVTVVTGRADPDVNRVVDPPSYPGTMQPLRKSFCRQFDLPLESDRKRGWTPHPLFKAPTPTLPYLSCHVSVLEPGVTPHPVHRHAEEELLIILDGAAELSIGESMDDPTPRREPVTSGDYVYYPALHPHTITNTGSEPVTYLMFKWQGALQGFGQPLEATLVRLVHHRPSRNARAFNPKCLFERPTSYLAKLHSHITDLQPGAGYQPHADEYDVAIVLLKGEIETMGRRLKAPATVFCGRGEQHGMHNPGRSPARYIVFELHGDDARPVSTQAAPLRQATDEIGKNTDRNAKRRDFRPMPSILRTLASRVNRLIFGNR